MVVVVELLNIQYKKMTITGTSKSRLSELKKYSVSSDFTKQYFGNGSLINDGVAYDNSIENNKIVYYIGGIKYTDIVSSNVTTFSYDGMGLSSPDFINVPIYKDSNKENIISYPKINDDVFIVRQELSAFDQNYKLEYIRNLSDLKTYAGGNFFKIVNNS